MGTKSCVYCIYGQEVKTAAYWEFPAEYDVDCSYPNLGNLGDDRDDMDLLDDSDLQDYAKNCAEYKHFQDTSIALVIDQHQQL